MEPSRPRSCRSFGVAIICALEIEADAVKASFDNDWDTSAGLPYDKAPGDPNVYFNGSIDRHNVVLVRLPGPGKVNAAIGASNCRASYPNIKLAILVGICSTIPLASDGNTKIALGDVIISEGVIEYDLGHQTTDRFTRKEDLLHSLGRPGLQVRSLLTKLKSLRSRRSMQRQMADCLGAIQYAPGMARGTPLTDRNQTFHDPCLTHERVRCGDCGCGGQVGSHNPLNREIHPPTVHFGLIASGDTVVGSKEKMDHVLRSENILAFDSESAGVWDIFPSIAIRGAGTYVDGTRTTGGDRRAASTAAACVKVLLSDWQPGLCSQHEEEPSEPCAVIEPDNGPWFIVPYARNGNFVERTAIMTQLWRNPSMEASQSRLLLFGLAGTGKTQIALEYANRFREANPTASVFWIRANTPEQINQTFKDIAQECQIPGCHDLEVDPLVTVSNWLNKTQGNVWLMVIDNADDIQALFPPEGGTARSDCEVARSWLGHLVPQSLDNGSSDELQALASKLGQLPMALVQATYFIQANSLSIADYISLVEESDESFFRLLSEEFETAGREPTAPRTVAQSWIVLFRQIQLQDTLAGELLSMMSFFHHESIPLEVLWKWSLQRQDRGPGSRIDFTKALGRLKAFSLVVEENPGYLSVHRLVHLVTPYACQSGNQACSMGGGSGYPHGIR
ncbi:kinesin light chain [Verticillium dahliae VdLs.17]|uniref:Kinesin light chain n=1 Tax=Verticillium dahliae (strain VdLs.17 / ATCC MYA-4575 / FGSC 10137) TaxID=498257 RepID=G2XA50_VERDV|nr:kinesin light chain [Verticillium dahliae VdLs.17]EGY15789.1 kinesin light chain [Verticillium dahliae VdLs.17]KAH6702328.1 kinesin light chain [Verticillium dahliae]